MLAFIEQLQENYLVQRMNAIFEVALADQR